MEDWLDIAKVNLQTMVKKNFIILDFQWYRFNSDIILPKELASCDSDFKRSHFVFRPVFSFGALTIADQHVANYAFYKHHGLKWTEGYTPLSEFDDIVRKLCADAEVVFVKGKEKKEFLSRILDKRIVDVVCAEKIRKGKPACGFHASEFAVCALANVERMYAYCI